MIDINSLPTPKVVQNLDYETTLAENLKYFRAIFPDWKPLEGDEHLAREYPNRDPDAVFFDSMSPHPSREAGLGAD